MPYTLEHKALSREKILSAAADLFCRYGFDAVSVSAVMKAAAMTHGGFYAHFKSKTELYADAIRYAASQTFLGKVDESAAVNVPLIELVESYLSMEHIKQESFACPLAFLSTDIAHREPVVRESYERTFKGMISKLSRFYPAHIQRERALSLAKTLVTRLVGTVSIARSLCDESLQQDLIETTKAELLRELNLLSGHR